jgi:lipopolysaccharide/colanic/teichoic acid biosynthesis glycosyltransferase
MKRLVDFIGSLVLIVVLTPLLMGIAIVIRMTSPGPVLFIQERIGLRGKVFRMLKFRTMFQNAEKMGTGLYSFEDDPRITRVGNILRRNSLDELPQLFNVLLGSMSLVGPRPPVTYELGHWKDYSYEMRKRFEVKPGITGLAQVLGRNELNWDEKIAFDNEYVDRISKQGVWIDFVILWHTLWVVLDGRNTVENDQSLKEKEGSVAALARDSGLPSSQKRKDS